VGAGRAAIDLRAAGEGSGRFQPWLNKFVFSQSMSAGTGGMSAWRGRGYQPGAEKLNNYGRAK
jgi:hypothetical protein